MFEKKKEISKRYLKSRWKHFLSRGKSGSLLIEGVSVEELRKKYGPPFFILVEAEIRNRLKIFKEAFNYGLFRPQYACKVNSNLEVLRIVREEGFDLDASSVGEIILGLLADFEPHQITFTNLYKTKQDILFAASVGVRAITIDSFEEIEKAIEISSKIKKNISLLIRVNPMIIEGNYSTYSQQYGIHYSSIPRAITRIISSEFLKFEGFHFHGSYAHASQNYLSALRRILPLVQFAAEKGAETKIIDLGGGFPIEGPKSYRPGSYFTPNELGKNFVPIFEQLFQNLSLKSPTLIFEPGKFIVGNAGIGLFEVISKKKVAKKELLLTNSSCYSMFPDVLISHCSYEILPASNMLSRRTHKYDIVGCTCDCLDVISKNQLMPLMKIGDMIAVMDCGAYSNVMSSNFNNLKRPPMILIRSDGTTKLIRRRDRYSEMFAPELDVLKVADPSELKKWYNLSRISLDKLWENGKLKVKE